MSYILYMYNVFNNENYKFSLITMGEKKKKIVVTLTQLTLLHEKSVVYFLLSSST